MLPLSAKRNSSLLPPFGRAVAVPGACGLGGAFAIAACEALTLGRSKSRIGGPQMSDLLLRHAKLAGEMFHRALPHLVCLVRVA